MGLVANAEEPGRCEGEVDDAFIREALDNAHPNALRMALYQVTGDPVLERMRPTRRNVGGREQLDYRLTEDEIAVLKAKAFAYLRPRPAGAPFPPPPSKTESRKLLEMYSAPLDDDDFEFSYEELAFEEFPRDVHWTAPPAPQKLAGFKAVVIGAGISGLAMAIQFKRLGIPFTVIERQAGLGGTWWLNTYPEIRVDTSSYLYQFKFEKNFRWTEYYPSGQETQEYLVYVARKYGVIDDFQFGREVIAADWDEAASRWHVRIRDRDGAEEVIDANLLVSASGLFSTPKMPDIPGIGDFQGPIFHTARWNHDIDYEGQRVAVIGTGSTATQLAPGIAPKTAKLVVFQRHPNWIMGQDNYRARVHPNVRWLFDNMPYYWNWYCYACYYTATQMQYLQTYDHEWRAKGGLISESNDRMREHLADYIRSKVGDDPELLAKVLPSHAPLTRRMVVDNGFYDMLRRDNVTLVTTGIERITKRGIRTIDGTEHEFDLILLGTGFAVQRFFWPVRYSGRDGITLEKAWEKDGVRSYLGLAMPGFPNFLIFYGPNGQPRSGGFYSWAEIWARYIGEVAVHMIENDIRSIDVKRSVFDAYNSALDEEMKKIIWLAEGYSYYVNEYGRQSLSVPWTTQQYHAMVRQPNFEDFELRGGGGAAS